MNDKIILALVVVAALAFYFHPAAIFGYQGSDLFDYTATAPASIQPGQSIPITINANVKPLFLNEAHGFYVNCPQDFSLSGTNSLDAWCSATDRVWAANPDPQVGYPNIAIQVSVDGIPTNYTGLSLPLYTLDTTQPANYNIYNRRLISASSISQTPNFPTSQGIISFTIPPLSAGTHTVSIAFLATQIRGCSPSCNDGFGWSAQQKQITASIIVTVPQTNPPQNITPPSPIYPPAPPVNNSTYSPPVQNPPAPNTTPPIFSLPPIFQPPASPPANPPPQNNNGIILLVAAAFFAYIFIFRKKVG